MASEILSVPEEHMTDVIKVIRMGLLHSKTVDREVREQLEKWCKEHAEYIDRQHDQPAGDE